MTPAILIFAADGRHPVCRFLRAGYRHVELLVWRYDRWWWLSWTGQGLDWGIMPGDFDPHAWAAENGWTALATHVRPSPTRPGPGLFTCVGLCKAALGIRAPLVLTPWQLARWIEKHG